MSQDSEMDWCAMKYVEDTATHVKAYLLELTVIGGGEIHIIHSRVGAILERPKPAIKSRHGCF